MNSKIGGKRETERAKQDRDGGKRRGGSSGIDPRIWLDSVLQLTLIRLNLDKKKILLTIPFSHKHTQGHINTHTYTLALKTHFESQGLRAIFHVPFTFCNPDSCVPPSLSLSLFHCLVLLLPYIHSTLS